MSALSQAIALAADVHEHQTDKAGEPYILHPLRVMQDAMAYESDNQTVGIVAVLHDVLEDNDKYDPEHLRKRIAVMADDDYLDLGPGISTLKMLELLTRKPGEDYLTEYIQRIKDSETWAITIKLADLRDNMTILRQPTLRDKDLLRIQKYHMAYRLLDARYPHG